MYARVTQLEFDPVRFDLVDALGRFEELVLPDLRDHPGFQGAYVLANEDAKGVVVTLWESKEDADTGVRSGFWAAQIAHFATLYAAAPGREGYDVVLAEAPLLVPD